MCNGTLSEDSSVKLVPCGFWDLNLGLQAGLCGKHPYLLSCLASPILRTLRGVSRYEYTDFCG